MAQALRLPSRDDAAAAAHHDATGLALGRDYARAGLVPPPEHLAPGHALRLGWEAGRPAVTARRRASRTDPAGALLLQTRLQAWSRGQPFDTATLTPRLVRSVTPEHCPITRRPLRLPGEAPRAAGAAAPVPSAQPAALVRLRSDAAWALGVVAVIDARAAARLETRSVDEVDGLSPAERARAATLRSFVTALPHDEAAALPLRVLPPLRLRLLNPVQALQAVLTLQLEHSGWSRRLPALEQLLPGVGLIQPAVRQELRGFFYALMARCIAIGRPGRRPEDRQAWRWTLEDAWAHPPVLLAWRRLAALIRPEQAEALVERAAEAGLCAQPLRRLDAAAAVDGWFPAGEDADTLAPAGAAPGAEPVRTPAASRPARPAPLPAVTRSLARATRGTAPQLTLPM